MSVKRSFAPVVDDHVRLLVCGSLPGDASLAAARYYAHPQNQFWKLMSPAVRCDLTALDYRERLAALLGAGVGLWDVAASATRPGSSDAAIRDLAVNDLARLAAGLRKLRAVAFNGGTALRYGRPLLEGMPIDVIALPSSSPLYTIGLAAKQSRWSDLERYLSDA